MHIPTPLKVSHSLLLSPKSAHIYILWWNPLDTWFLLNHESNCLYNGLDLFNSGAGYYQGPPVMAPPQYQYTAAAPPPRRQTGFLEGWYVIWKSFIRFGILVICFFFFELKLLWICGLIWSFATWLQPCCFMLLLSPGRVLLWSLHFMYYLASSLFLLMLTPVFYQYSNGSIVICCK